MPLRSLEKPMLLTMAMYLQMSTFLLLLLLHCSYKGVSSCDPDRVAHRTTSDPSDAVHLGLNLDCNDRTAMLTWEDMTDDPNFFALTVLVNCINITDNTVVESDCVLDHVGWGSDSSDITNAKFFRNDVHCVVTGHVQSYATSGYHPIVDNIDISAMINTTCKWHIHMCACTYNACIYHSKKPCLDQHVHSAIL